jgi:DNA-binding transcriptional ArsR family regulator
MAIGKRRKVKRKRRPRDLPSPAALAKALGHPVRVQALTILIDRISSPKEIAAQLGKQLPNVSYHVRQLERLGLIELVEEEPVSGSVAHFFQAIEPETIRALLGQFQFAAPSTRSRDDA